MFVNLALTKNKGGRTYEQKAGNVTEEQNTKTMRKTKKEEAAMNLIRFL